MRWLSPSSRQTRSAPQNRQPRFVERHRWNPTGRTMALWSLALCLAQLAWLTAAEPAASAVENFLRHVKGLSNIPGGKVWLCGAERTLRNGLASLGDARRELTHQQRALEQRIQQNAQAWETNRQTIAALKAALTKTNTDAPERQRIQQQIQLLESQAVEPDQLAGMSDVRARLIRFTNTRQTLALTLLTIQRAVPQMEADYRRLAADLEVQTALRSLGEDHRLGPLETYRAELRRLQEYEQLVLTPWLPIYVQSGRMRVGAILNERAPLTFSWNSDGGPTVLTETMLEAAGVELAADAPTVPLSRGQGRTLNARKMTVPTLRFGQVVLRDVPVHVLGSEGEDLGASIGPAAFAEYDVQEERARLQLTIRARAP
jgi:hypothetical protein